MLNVQLIKSKDLVTLSWYQSFDENPKPVVYSLNIIASDFPSLSMNTTESKVPIDAFIELLESNPNIKLKIIE